MSVSIKGAGSKMAVSFKGAGSKLEKTYDIEVEISPSCNLSCPDCLVQNRIYSQEEQQGVDLSLVDKAIKYIPDGTRLIFSGLGEPLLKQNDISKILSARKDLTGYIQTNGTISLGNELIDRIKDSRLEVGVSLDNHHKQGGQKALQIQPEYVSAFSMSTYNNSLREFDFDKFKDKFQNIERIVIDPHFDGQRNIATPWQEVEESCGEFARNLPDVDIYIQIFSLWQKEGVLNAKYYQDALESVSKGEQVADEWTKLQNGAYVHQFPEAESIRLLTNGELVMNTINVNGKRVVNPIKTCDPISEIKAKAFPEQFVKIEDYFPRVNISQIE